MAIEKTAIQKMRENTWNGITGQNGSNDHFYRVYDKEGKIVGSKEGIVTNPSEMMPRSVNVDFDLSGFKPEAVDPTVRPRAFIEVDGKEPGETLQVNGQKWRMEAAKGELADFTKEASEEEPEEPTDP